MARAGGPVQARAEPRPGITGGRPTWAMADSQRLMLSVWRKCKPVAWKGRRGAASSSRLPPCGAQTAAWRLEEPEAPAPSAPWPCRDRRRPAGTTGGCPAGRRGQGQGAGAGRLAGAQGGPTRPGGTAWGCRLWVAESALLLGGRGDPKARPASAPCCYGQGAAPGREPSLSAMIRGTLFILQCPDSDCEWCVPLLPRLGEGAA